ncbi:MAG: hypothetical protein LBH96_00100 [Candidatus Peribacteria bacterium]|jgi:hypothetical protein|nr:hypothetical protein [Candidatus Peribacteria bacterium]
MKKLSDEELSDMEILKNVYVQKLLEDRGYKVLDDEGNIQLPKQKSNPSEEEVLLEEENKSLNRFSW